MIGASNLKANPIGYIKTEKRLKFDAPHQPNPSDPEESIIELLPKQNLDQALQDLEGFDYIWLIWWFHRNKTWRPLVLPPRGGRKRRGVFATRSPHRPNPIGLTAVPLLRISGRTIWIGSHDLVDGTPILDIKPYISGIDSFPEARSGWVSELEASLTETEPFTVTRSERAQTQLAWLSERNVQFIERAEEMLSIDPSPHPTRRIAQMGENEFRMGCGAWRIYYSIEDRSIEITRIEPGYPLTSLNRADETVIPHYHEQLEFTKTWPDCYQG